MLVEGGATFLKMKQEGRPAQGLGLLGGMGLLTNPDFEHWRTQRRMMQPMFHRARLASMGDKVEQAAAQMFGRWEGLETVDIDAEMLNVTVDIICRTIFSADISGDAGRAAQASEVTLQFLTKLIFSAVKLPVGWPLPGNRRFTRTLATIDEIIFGLIDARAGSVDKCGDLLDMLLEARDADTGGRADDPAAGARRGRHSVQRGPRNHRPQLGLDLVSAGPAPAGTRWHAGRAGHRAGGTATDHQRPETAALHHPDLSGGGAAVPSGPHHSAPHREAGRAGRIRPPGSGPHHDERLQHPQTPGVLA